MRITDLLKKIGYEDCVADTLAMAGITELEHLDNAPGRLGVRQICGRSVHQIIDDLRDAAQGKKVAVETIPTLAEAEPTPEPGKKATKKVSE